MFQLYKNICLITFTPECLLLLISLKKGLVYSDQANLNVNLGITEELYARFEEFTCTIDKIQEC